MNRRLLVYLSALFSGFFLILVNMNYIPFMLRILNLNYEVWHHVQTVAILGLTTSKSGHQSSFTSGQRTIVECRLILIEGR